MEDKEEEKAYTHTSPDGKKHVTPRYQRLRQRLNLTEQDLDWLASEIGKRIAKQAKANGRPMGGIE